MEKEKIKNLIDKMLREKDKIGSVTKEINPIEESEEYYFTYPSDKYYWSVNKDSIGEYHIFYYPEKNIKSEYLRFSRQELGSTVMVSLRDLFELLRGKLYGFDSVLDDILG